MLRRAFKITGLAILLPLFFLALSATYEEPAAVREPAPPRPGSDRGLYVTYWVASGGKRFSSIKEQARAAGLNTLVIDAKEVLSRPLLELAKERKLGKGTKPTADPWLAKLTEELHQQGFIVTVRLVVFKDDHLVIARPDLAVRLPSGELYRDRKYGRWADPNSDEVRLYNQLIAERAALSGVDEVQFDYIRFPAEGKARYAVYPFARPERSKVDVIELYLKEARERLKPYGVSIAVDIFGVVAWQSRRDIENLGQDLKRMAKHIDVISPMLYPSHFHAGYDGHANPGSEPYYFMYNGLRRTQQILSQESVAIVPWLQGFNMRSPNFGPGYILAQVQACHDLGIKRYLVWNANNDYWATFAGLKGK